MLEAGAFESLATAMHRKLRAVGQDIRDERAKKYPNTKLLLALKVLRKRLDIGYSACVVLSKNHDEAQRERDYKTLLALYQQT